MNDDDTPIGRAVLGETYPAEDIGPITHLLPLVSVIRCSRCNAPLTRGDSRLRGMGAICAERDVTTDVIKGALAQHVHRDPPEPTAA
jgi:hypothetical protein